MGNRMGQDWNTITGGKVTSCLKVEEISALGSIPREELQQNFSEEERLELDSGPDRTIAGNLAAKRAVIGLIGQLGIAKRIDEKEVKIGRGLNGKPLLKAIGSTTHIKKEEIFISISHTNDKAWGLAVFQELSNKRTENYRSENNCEIDFTVEEEIGFLELSSPPKNEMNALFFKQLTSVLDEEISRLDLRGLIVSGRGRHFSSGANIGELKTLMEIEGKEKYQRLLEINKNNYLKLEQLKFPVIAAIRGCCLGAGMELALACHYRIATKHAVFSLPETTFDLMPGCGGTIRLSRLIGIRKATELILTGRTLLADEAKTLGIVDTIVDNKEFMTTAKRIAARIR